MVNTYSLFYDVYMYIYFYNAIITDVDYYILFVKYVVLFTEKRRFIDYLTIHYGKLHR